MAGLVLLILVTVTLAAAVIVAAPQAWEATIAERKRARHEVLGTAKEMRPGWSRARAAVENARGD